MQRFFFSHKFSHCCREEKIKKCLQKYENIFTIKSSLESRKFALDLWMGNFKTEKINKSLLCYSRLDFNLIDNMYWLRRLLIGGGKYLWKTSCGELKHSMKFISVWAYKINIVEFYQFFIVNKMNEIISSKSTTIC